MNRKNVLPQPLILAAIDKNYTKVFMTACHWVPESQFSTSTIMMLTIIFEALNQFQILITDVLIPCNFSKYKYMFVRILNLYCMDNYVYFALFVLTRSTIGSPGSAEIMVTIVNNQSHRTEKQRRPQWVTLVKLSRHLTTYTHNHF